MDIHSVKQLNVMAWLAVDKKGNERIFRNKPNYDWWEWLDEEEVYAECQRFDISTEIELPKGTIKKIIGRDLTFEESPFEIK